MIDWPGAAHGGDAVLVGVFGINGAATDLNAGTFVGGFWSEVDESSMILLKLTCAAATAAKAQGRSAQALQPTVSVASGASCAVQLLARDNELRAVHDEVVTLKAALAAKDAELAAVQAQVRE